ncbi:MAG TPA: DUF2806 domain-containing protein [Bradyrhizobium sp.]|nr:DUF2806 domain-containing protein [Bradyrhizobium sp.]
MARPLAGLAGITQIGTKLSQGTWFVKMKDLVGIGKTVKTVSDAVRGAVSVLYRPTAIRKEGRARIEVAASRLEAIAKAEVRAAQIRQEGEITLADRAKQRFLFEQSMQQQSLENILVKAVEYSKKQKKRKGRKIPEHWLYRLLINVKDVTDEEVQDIFAKLIVEQGSEGKSAISYMTLDALRLFEPRHARYFKAFCQLYYLFGSVCFGLDDPDSDEWIGDEEFGDLEELGMVEGSQLSGSLLAMGDCWIEIRARKEGDDLQSIFGTSISFSRRGAELSKVLYPEVSQQYWGSVRKNLKKSIYESTMAEFIAPDVQLKCFKDILDIITDDETPFTISVSPWHTDYSKRDHGERYVVVEYNGEWTVQPKAPRIFYVPPYLRRFLDELRGK